MHGQSSHANYEVYIYESEYNLMIAQAQEFIDKETGGSVFGTLTHGGMFIIGLASGPGPKARGSGGDFEQDVDFLNYWQGELMKTFALQFIGGWHSHHTLGIKQPSGLDSQVIQKYAIRHDRQTALEIIVTHDSPNRQNFTTVPRAYFYWNAQEQSYVEAKFKILEGESPFRAFLREQKKSFSKVSQKINWKTVSPKREIKSNNWFGWGDQSSESSNTQRKHQGDSVPNNSHCSEEDVDFPQQIKRAIDSLQTQYQKDIDVQSKSNKFMMIIPLEVRLAIALEKVETNIKILQINLIDDDNNTNQNITQYLLEKGILSDDNSSLSTVLGGIIKEALTVQKELMSHPNEKDNR
ncbi:hypothetical protein [Microcoleus sp. CAWBG640]|uniref:hypothetical protein n=1 Tax=Microcoleus sp. CAWBG640 TaxID=2841653 RepID=UPI00312B8838